MKKTLTIMLVALAAMTTAVQALDFTRISSEQSFRMLVVDRTLKDDFGGTRIFTANGALTGRHDRSVVSGGWVWNNQSLCQRTRLDGLVVENDCKHLYIRGNILVMQQNRGRSSEETWTIN